MRMSKDIPEKQIDLFQDSVHRDLYIAISNQEFSFVNSQLKKLLEQPSREVLILAVIAILANPKEPIKRTNWAMKMCPVLSLIMLYDPQEDDPIKGPLIEAAKAEAAEMLADEPGSIGIGSCHVHWGTKKIILKEKYNINWQTPAEMNPGWMFD